MILDIDNGKYLMRWAWDGISVWLRWRVSIEMGCHGAGYPMGARDTPIVWYHVVLPPISSHVRSISDPFRYKKKYGVLWFLDWGNSSDIKGCLQGIPPKKIEAMIFTHPRRPEEDLRLQIKVPWRTEVSPPIVDPGGYVLNTSPLV